MISKDCLLREDGKLFLPTVISHWSTIQADDGEKDEVKWIGGTEYVSMYKGWKYILKEKDV
jgi:hypothetical protein